MALIDFPILYVNDPFKGRPLFNAKFFVGTPDLDPEIPINQKQLRIVQEDGTKVDIAQPFVLSAGGVPVYNGATVRLDVEGNYSLKILDKNNAQTYYIHNVFEGQPVTEESLPDLLINDLSQAYEFDTLADATSFADLKLGKVIRLKVRTALNQDSGGICDTVSTLLFTPNGYDLIAHDTLPLVYKVRFENAQVPMDRLGAISQNGFNNSPVVQRMFNLMIETGYEGLIGAGTYLCDEQVNLDEAKGTPNFQFKLRGVGYSSNYLDSDSKCNLVANVAVLGTSTPLIKLDLTDLAPVSPTATRFTATLTDFNVTSTGGASFAGIQMKHCWYSFERLGIKGHINGYNSIESYRGSTNKCAITGNVNNILFSGYNSVQTITDNQLRASSANMIAFDANYVPDATTTTTNQLIQSLISGNNTESNPTNFNFADGSDVSHVYMLANYGEAGAVMIDGVGCKVRNVYFKSSGVGYNFKFDDAQFVDIETNQGSLETTDKSINIEFDNDDAFSQVLGQNNKQQKQSLTTDSLLNFHGLFSLDNGEIFLPPEFRNTTVSSAATSWESSTPFYPNTKYLRFEMNGTSLIRTDFTLRPLQSEVIPSVGYRVRGSITIRTNSSDNIALRAKVTGGSFFTATNLVGTSGDWVTYPFTIDVPNDSIDLAITLNSGTAVDLEIDSFIIALVSNPFLQKQEQVRKVITIPASSFVAVSATHSMSVEFLANDSVASISTANQLGSTVTITNNDAVDRQGLMIISPAFGY